MTVYYVLNQLGPHSKGDVLSFSPEQIGAGVDISHLTAIGAIRVASGGEIARAVPAQIQATHAPQGVGVFTNNGVPDGTTYAGIAAYGSLCWNVSVSPPAIYVNTGTIAAPIWTASGGGGAFLPAVTSGPLPTALLGVTPDPTYNPAYTFVSGDLATSDSWYGDALVHYVTWTPTISGTVFLLPPDDDGASQNVAYEVWAGSIIGTDVPSRDGSGVQLDSLAYAEFKYTAANRTGSRKAEASSFSATSGQIYTVVVQQFPDSNATLPTGRAVSLRPWVRSTQPLGGQAPLVSYTPTAVGFPSLAEQYGTTSSPGAHAESAGSALAAGSHAEGSAVVTGPLAHGEGADVAVSGRFAHGEGQGQIVSGQAAHGEGSTNRVSGGQAHGEGINNDVSGTAAHAEGEDNTASGQNAHVEGADNTASGFNSHVQGQESTASAQASDAKGDQANASIRAETAHASGSHVAQGDSEYRRIIPYHETTDATPTQINPGSGQPMPLGTNATWQLLIQVTASRHDTPGTTACWSLAAAITTCGTPRIVGTPTVLSHHNDAAAVGWDVALSVDTTTDPTKPALAITVTGEAAQIIYWTGTVHASHVGV